MIVDGPAVLVPASVALELTSVLERAKRVARVDGLRLTEQALVVLDELADAALQHRRRQAAHTPERTVHPPPRASPVDSRPMLSTAEAAARLGCSQRNVQARLERGTLTGRRVGRVWLVDDPATLETDRS